jgi:hypothetical protein
MNDGNELRLSVLDKTWILDLDGTIVVHNGYRGGKDELLPGVKELFNSIPGDDYILIVTARKEKERKTTEDFLKRNKIRYNAILFEIPAGERILINDDKPSGLKTAHAVNVARDRGLKGLHVVIDRGL